MQSLISLLFPLLSFSDYPVFMSIEFAAGVLQLKEREGTFLEIYACVRVNDFLQTKLMNLWLRTSSSYIFFVRNAAAK